MILLFFLGLYCVSLVYCVNIDQITSLEWLYNTTNSAAWHWSKATLNTAIWNFENTSNICSWQGICCSDNFGKLEVSVTCEEMMSEITSHLQTIIGPVVEIQAIENSLVKESLPPNSIVGVTLRGYNLNGSLPSQFFGLTSLQYLSLPVNNLFNTIPASISNMDSLTWLTLSSNNHSGSIPMEITNLQELVMLDIDMNNLHGIIPISIGSLSNLVVFTLWANFLSGSIPVSIGELRQLMYLDFNGNYIVGTIPVSITNLINASYVYLSDNILTGTVPEILSNCTNLVIISLDLNVLTGPLPNIAPLHNHKFHELALNDNLFTGTIPTCLSIITSLKFLSIDNNLLTGTVPEALATLELETLYLSNNLLTGTLNNLLAMTSLKLFYVGSNHLGGTITSAIGLLQNLMVLSMQDNYFSGTLPFGLSELTRLGQVFLQQNHFYGPIDGKFGQGQVFLDTIELSENSFTGSLASVIFELPFIRNVIIVSACFDGKLPANICNATSLNVLALNGITTGRSCRHSLLSSSYIPNSLATGTIPSCLFAMPGLHTLQLSGNGFYGLLPSGDDFKISPTLLNLTLSHNRLSGAIPTIFQHPGYLEIMDLSFNRLGGDILAMSSYFTPVQNHTVITSHQPKRELVLEVNQLSGLLPSEFWDPSHMITVVNGNLFGCEGYSLTAQLPPQDPGSATTYCGSNNLDIALILGAVVVMITLALVVVTVYVPHWKKELSVSDVQGEDRVARSTLTSIGRRSMIVMVTETATLLEHITACIRKSDSVPLWAEPMGHVGAEHVLSGMPVTTSFLQFVKTMQRITWVTCFCVLLPAMLLQIAIKYVNNSEYSSHSVQYAFAPSLAYIKGIVPAAVTVTMVIVLASLLHRTVRLNYANATRIAPGNPAGLSQNCRKLFVIAVTVTADVVIMGGANVFYVFYSLGYLNKAFTSSRNVALLEIILGIVKGMWNLFGLPLGLHVIKRNMLADQLSSIMPTALLAFLMITNNIFIPIIVTMASDPNCFYYVFVEQPTIEFHYVYKNMCLGPLASECRYDLSALVDTVSYEPPFMYGYQCGSAVLNFYAPVFVAMYSFFIVLSPIMCSLLPYLFSHVTHPATKRVLGYMQSPITQTKLQCLEDIDSNRVILTTDMISGSLISSFTMLLTFGIAYPLLGLLIAVVITVDVYQQRYLIGRYLSNCAEVAAAQSRVVLLAKMEFCCCGTYSAFDRFKWFIVVTVALFYSLFVLDMAGNTKDVGWDVVVWFPLTVLIWPAVVGLLDLFNFHPISYTHTQGHYRMTDYLRRSFASFRGRSGAAVEGDRSGTQSQDTTSTGVTVAWQSSTATSAAEGVRGRDSSNSNHSSFMARFKPSSISELKTPLSNQEEYDHL